MTKKDSLERLEKELLLCRECPRLATFRETISEKKRLAYAGETYWGRPVPSFGDPKASILILGLAPGAHGANRTGRVFTGDRSGDFLYAALHRIGIASQPRSDRRNDGLVLRGLYVTLAARCVPPDNHPSPEEVRRCGAWLDRELALLSPHVVLALGNIAWGAFLDHLRRIGVALPRPRPRFEHGAIVQLSGAPILVGSYHVSQQNTQTGRLTNAMFDTVLRRCVALSEANQPSCAASRDPRKLLR